MGVIFTLQWVEQSRLRFANGVALFYWLLLLISFTVKLRSLISQQLYSKNLAYFVTFCIGLGLTGVEFFVEWLWPRNASADGYEAIEEEEECPVEYADVFSRLTFSWMTPMMARGYKIFLTETDLWGLAKIDQTKNTGEAFEDAWQYELKARPNKPNLWIAMLRAYGGPYAIAAIYKVFNDLIQYVQPQLLRYIIRFVESYDPRVSDTPDPVVKGAALTLAMFACGVFQTTMVVSILTK